MINIQLIHFSTIATTLVILGGVAIVLPDFIRVSEPTRILLTFDIIYENKLPEWCKDLSNVLQTNDVKATVFISGILTSKYPSCINSFDESIDIGSQTYNYVNLNSISDYSIQLEEIKNGKNAIDITGNLDSKLFKAPYGNTDDNIYSLLDRSNIVADFSYDLQYNKFHDGKFIKYKISKYNYTDFSNKLIHNPEEIKEPIIINFENTSTISDIEEFISDLKTENVRFVSASDVVETQLTIRNGGSS